MKKAYRYYRLLRINRKMPMPCSICYTLIDVVFNGHYRIQQFISMLQDLLNDIPKFNTYRFANAKYHFNNIIRGDKEYS